MKIEQNVLEPEFVPITITLETRQEAAWMKALVSMGQYGLRETNTYAAEQLKTDIFSFIDVRGITFKDGK